MKKSLCFSWVFGFLFFFGMNNLAALALSNVTGRDFNLYVTQRCIFSMRPTGDAFSIRVDVPICIQLHDDETFAFNPTEDSTIVEARVSINLSDDDLEGSQEISFEIPLGQLDDSHRYDIHIETGRDDMPFRPQGYYLFFEDVTNEDHPVWLHEEFVDERGVGSLCVAGGLYVYQPFLSNR